MPEIRHKMEGVLISIAYIYPSLGYRYGMSFIVGEFINTFNTEDLSFWLFFGLLNKYHLDQIFMGGLYSDLYIHLFKVIIETFGQELTKHLHDLGSDWHNFAKNFALSLGAIYIPLEFLAQIFDIFFMDGWLGLCKIVVSLLKFYEEKMIIMNLEEVIDFMKKLRRSIKKSEMQIILYRATKVHINKNLVEKAIDSFFKCEAEKCLSEESKQKNWHQKFTTILQPALDNIKELVLQYTVDVELCNTKLSQIEVSLTKHFYI